MLRFRIVSPLLFVLAAALALAGCGLFKHLEVESVAVSTDKPSNVALYLAVMDGQEPVVELTEQSFQIFENEQPIPADETKQMLLDRDVSALFRTLLLIDLSVAKNEGTRRQMARAVAGFVQNTRKAQGVTVYAFDGSPDLKLIGDFPKGGAGPDEVKEIVEFTNIDPSRNLHGAVIAGIKELGARLMEQQKPVRIGTLVIVTAGPDLAGRNNADQMQAAVDAAGYQMVTIGVGEENAYNILPIGKHGTIWAPSLEAVGPVLDDAASRVEALRERHYLLSYCSPARAGKRNLKIEVTHHNAEGDARKGSVVVEFDASGFGPGCDPSKPPSFGVARVETESKPATPESEPKPEEGATTAPPTDTQPADKPEEAKPPAEPK